MAEPRVYPTMRPRSIRAGIISKIKLQDFMCHSNLEIELGDHVNFITGQNGSGKSAILTALCIAFGSRARSTQRASTMKDFIKTGSSAASVHVEIKNEGEDAFKPETYGDLIILERQITQSSTTTILKNSQGKKVASKRGELDELVAHFSIDVDNPCVIMSQDKSREFLHSGNSKDKFNFFYKATLLQRLGDLLNNVDRNLNAAAAHVGEMERSLGPLLRELEELEAKIKSMEQVEEISQEVQLLKKKLAWSWVYDVDRQLQDQTNLIEKLNQRIPTCQSKIDQQKCKMDELSDRIKKKKTQTQELMARASEVRRMKDDMQQSLEMAVKARLELESNLQRKTKQIEKMVERVKALEVQINDMQELHLKDTQAEALEMEQKLKVIQDEIDEGNVQMQRLEKELESLQTSVIMLKEEIASYTSQIEENEKKHRDFCSQIRDLRQNQANKVLAFGGNKVIHLLQAIEKHHRKFRMPPIGPIGSHLTLDYGDDWGIAVEHAIGGLFNAFIVTDHSDLHQLRACAKEANYNNLKIIIYDFSRPKLNIPRHMLPHTNHPTVLSVLHSDMPTVINVLIDVGNAERQVLVKDYDTGKVVAFDQRVPNLKEVFLSDGRKLFSRGSGQSTLPAMRNIRASRLSGSYDKQINYLEGQAAHVKQQAEEARKLKRKKEEELRLVENNLMKTKRRCMEAELYLNSKERELQGTKSLYASDASASPTSTIDELRQEIANIEAEKEGREVELAEAQRRMSEAGHKANSLKSSFEKMCESAKVDIDALEEADRELTLIERDFSEAERKKKYYEEVMDGKVLPELNAAKSQYRELEDIRKESCRKASIICSESEIEALEGCMEGNPEQLSARLNRLNQRLERESQRFHESIDDLRMLHEKKRRKIWRKEQTYKAFKDKLNVCRKALELRQEKFQRNATLARRELTWKFNDHLGKKGISGKVVVSYESQTLSIEVTMPQDASNRSVCDTRGLSGGERSFSTLCFALALHEMTEAPFRAMDEFDVFMDAVSRKISLDTLVDFALAQGSQWIFITPHDISMVKQDERIKKQQMLAPRG
ncbi:OLC1v1027166C1 [Oldenlandia corymbosa var. corymbosa]|uniref:OLC1v1027166C1 n=1 Tax=Oldenlandia corymbosa var. corymbosa TaxID=529605 RepID=A0AAV1C9B8_OLDCO|nr:OLC1v1027166C1 [Oldenlandia corymbosa var. corymbosa]